MHSSLIKQEVWPPGLANMVCSHSPLMTQVQHFVSQIKKRQRWDVQMMWAIDFDLWPWSSPRLSVIHVLVFCQSTKCKFRTMTHTGQTYHVTLWPWPLTLQVMALASDAGLRLYVLHPHTHGVPSCQFWWYYDYSFSIYGPFGQHGSDWSRDLETFQEVMTAVADAGRRRLVVHPFTEFEVHRPCHSEDMAHDVCQH